MGRTKRPDVAAPFAASFADPNRPTPIKLRASASKWESYIHQFSVRPVSRQLAEDTDRPESLNEWFVLFATVEKLATKAVLAFTRRPGPMPVLRGPCGNSDLLDPENGHGR